MFAPSFAVGCLAGFSQALPVWRGDLLPRAAVSKRKMCVCVCVCQFSRDRALCPVSASSCSCLVPCPFLSPTNKASVKSLGEELLLSLQLRYSGSSEQPVEEGCRSSCSRDIPRARPKPWVFLVTHGSLSSSEIFPYPFSALQRGEEGGML